MINPGINVRNKSRKKEFFPARGESSFAVQIKKISKGVRWTGAGRGER
jgi:hypothetical protein